MSAIADVKAVQTILGVVADGIPGAKTESAWDTLKEAALRERQGGSTGSGAITDAVDARSEKNIATLLPQVQPLARKLVTLAAAKGITMVVTSGTRTYAEQDALYQKHLAGGPKAARPGYSNHNFGLAFDLTEFKNGQPVWESPNYTTVGEIGESLGLSWGGRWQGGDEDPPHYSLRPAWAKNLSERDLIAGLRQRNQSGTDVFS